MKGTHLEAELFLGVSADFSSMKRKELIALRGVQNIMCQVVKCLGSFHATVLPSFLTEKHTSSYKDKFYLTP